MRPVVFVDRIKTDPEYLTKQFQKSFSLLDLQNQFDHARAVFIKPNLTYPTYKKGVTTRKEFVENLVAALREINTTTKIYIGEGEGGYNSFSMTEAMRVMGFYEIEKKYSNVTIINLTNVLK